MKHLKFRGENRKTTKWYLYMYNYIYKYLIYIHTYITHNIDIYIIINNNLHTIHI